MYDNNDAAAGLPIDSELEISLKERARQLYEQYDISPEEAMRLARAEYMETQDNYGESPPASPPPAAAPPAQDMSPESRLRGQYEAAGMGPERASRIAANEARMYGPQGAAAKAGEQDSEAGRSRLSGVAAQLEADDARHQRMYDDYFSATAAPSHRRPLSASQQQMEDESRRYSAEARRIIHSGLHPQTPIDPGTPESLAEWESFLADNPRARARWRPDEVAAEEQASRDKEMEAVFQNIGQTYGPDEEAKAREAHGRGVTYIPQTADQASRNERYRTLRTDAMKGDDDARQRLRAADANVNYDALNEQQRAALRQPGGPVSQQARTRWADAAGLSDAEAARMSNNDLRRLAADARAGDKAKRDLQWRPRTMIRGGNAIGALALPGMGDAQEAAILGGPTPLAVEAAVGARAADMARQAVVGFLANNPSMTPEQRAALEQRLRQGDPAAAGTQDIASGNYESPMAAAELGRLAEQYDTGTFGVDDENMMQMAAALQRPPYNLRQSTAEDLAWRYMNRRSWSLSGLPRPPRGAGVPPAAASSDSGDLPTTGW